MTAKYLLDIDAAAVGTALLLERLSPYENGDRVPVTIIDAVLERKIQAPDQDGADTPAARRLQPLVEAVSYCMQSDTLAAVRPSAETYLDSIQDGPQMRYFKRRRLTKLQLPGGLPPAVASQRPLAKVEQIGRRAVRKLKSAVAREAEVMTQTAITTAFLPQLGPVVDRRLAHPKPGSVTPAEAPE